MDRDKIKKKRQTSLFYHFDHVTLKRMVFLIFFKYPIEADERFYYLS